MQARGLQPHAARTAMHAAVAAAMSASAVIPVLLPAQDDVRAGIRSAFDRMEEAYWTGNTRLMLDILADDAVLLPPGQETIAGRAALEERYTRYFSERRVKISMEIDELRTADGWAVVVGSTSNPGEDGTTTKFIIVLDQAPDGMWKLSRLIWNDDPDE